MTNLTGAILIVFFTWAAFSHLLNGLIEFGDEDVGIHCLVFAIAILDPLVTLKITAVALLRFLRRFHDFTQNVDGGHINMRE